MAVIKSDAAPVSTGLPNLDYVLGGGYAFNRTHLVEGRPGSGKTTLALQFLVDGRDRGERCMFITISEGAEELRRIAATHGLSLDGIDLFELVPPEHSLDSSQEQSIVYAGDLELGETIQLVMDSVRASRPERIVFGSFSEIRLLSQEALRYRRQVLALEHFFASQVCTALFLDNLLTSTDDINLQSLAHGVIRLEQIAVPYGTERRRLRVTKMRGRAFHGGYHDFAIRRGGLVVFPRLVSDDHECAALDEIPAPSGIAELDNLIGGGLDRGTTTLIRGPSGAGKSALALQFLSAALTRGEKALFISFDETRRNFERRADALAMPIRSSLENGQLTFMRIDPAELSPGEMADIIRHLVIDGVRAVVLDSLSGYQHAMPEENNLLLHLHELLTYLNQQGVLTILVLAHTMVDGTFASPEYTTYLADTVLLVRQFEAEGDIKRALSVMKKRTGAHERSIRELFFDAGGLRVGQPLTGFSELMSANPVYAGNDVFLVARPAGATR